MLKGWSIVYRRLGKKGWYHAIKWYKLEIGVKRVLTISRGWWDGCSSGPEGICCTCSRSYNVDSFAGSVWQSDSRAMLSLTISPQMRLCRCFHLKAFLQRVSHMIKWGKPVWVNPCQPPCLFLSRSSHLLHVTFFHKAGRSGCTVVALPNIRQPLHAWGNLFIFLERVNNWDASPARARGNRSHSILIWGMIDYLKTPEMCSLLKPERRETLSC